MQHVGEVLFARGLVSRRDLAEAAQAIAHGGGPVDAALIRLGAVGEQDVLAALSEHLSLPLLSSEEQPQPDAVRGAVARLSVSAAWLANVEAIPWFSGEGKDARLHIASRRPLDPALQEAMERWQGEPAHLHLASSQAIAAMLVAAELSGDRDAERVVDLAPARLMELAKEAPVIDFVNAMVTEALARSASDIHIEPFQDTLNIRLRVDGVLTHWRSAPRSQFDAIASRIKLLSGMDIAERRLPQDGRQSFRVAGREIDVRISALPTTWGESLVLRFLGKTARLPELDDLGVAPDHRKALHRVLAPLSGMMLVTGPTGSGKTTTVYRLLMNLNDGVHKIVTVEDPVEIDLPGVMQVQARPDIGLDFARGLRSILRQDPDIILVGEIRDRETASIAVQAALTGHLVISTVHTNTALGAISRLRDLGIESYLIADVLRCVIGQRLVRRVCEACAVTEPDTAAEDFLAEQNVVAEGSSVWRSGKGCHACGHTGYSGRIGSFEVIEIGPPLREAIRERASEGMLTTLARARANRSLFHDALLKARAGATTLREALRLSDGAAP